MSEPITLGISSCLLGNKVRYDGGHKQDHFITDTLGRYMRFVAVCPEVECGLPVPREAMHLSGEIDRPRLVGVRSGIDHTERMQTWAAARLDALSAEPLCGFIFKKDSPSSGMMRVKVYTAGGMPEKKGVGLFARAFMQRYPLIPTEEEGRLHDPLLRENFIERIFALQRWRALLMQGKRVGSLVAFHTAEKLLLLSHSPAHYRAMGKFVAAAKQQPLAALYGAYENLFMQALTLHATPAKHVNVLHHILGYFKKQLSADEKQEMGHLLHDYRAGHLPLIVPITLVSHFVRKYGQAYLAGQTYLNPHPIALQLRNHA